MIDPLKSNQAPKTQLYKVEWGPLIYDSNNHRINYKDCLATPNTVHYIEIGLSDWHSIKRQKKYWGSNQRLSFTYWSVLYFKVAEVDVWFSG